MALIRQETDLPLVVGFGISSGAGVGGCESGGWGVGEVLWLTVFPKTWTTTPLCFPRLRRNPKISRRIDGSLGNF